MTTTIRSYTPADTDAIVALSLAASVIPNPQQLTSEAIDDYKVQFAEAASRMELTPYTRDAIRDAYGVNAFVTVSEQY